MKRQVTLLSFSRLFSSNWNLHKNFHRGYVTELSKDENPKLIVKNLLIDHMYNVGSPSGFMSKIVLNHYRKIMFEALREHSQSAGCHPSCIC